MKANLSRIHALITQTAVDIRRMLEEARQPLETNGRDFIIPVLESTTEADIRGFMERIGDKRIRIMDSLQKCRHLLEYSFYLRRELDTANRASGVADMLLELNNIKKLLSHMYSTRQIISLSCSQGLQELKNADYYKAAFTDSQKVYDLPVRMFGEADYSAIQEEINRTEKQSFEISNEIAYLNQTTVIEILSLEEFPQK